MFDYKNYNKPVLRAADHLIFPDDIDTVFDNATSEKIKRKLVVCLIENDIGGLAGYLKMVKSDAVVMMLSSNISLEAFNNIVFKYQPSYVWIPSTQINKVRAGVQLASKYGYCLFELESKSFSIDANLALLLATSGSTGSPRFVRLSKQNLISNARSISEYLNLKSDDIPITTLPPSYSYGLSIIHSHILVGASIAVTNKTFFDREFWDFLKNIEATSFGGVPYHYEILKKLRFSKMNLPSLRAMTQAGGRMDSKLTKEFALYCQQHDIQFFTMYGQAEATARMSYLPAQRAVTKAGSIGIAIPNGDFSLVDEDGNQINQDDVPGELVYRGPNVSMGYADGYEDLAKGDERNGVLRTGDVAKRDKDGDYFIVGRLKRFIKLFGHRINLQDVETHLFDMGYCIACAGQDDRLEVYASDITEAQSIDIKRRVIEFLQVTPVAVVVYVIYKIPRNAAGKIQYSELKPDICDPVA